MVTSYPLSPAASSLYAGNAAIVKLAFVLSSVLSFTRFGKTDVVAHTSSQQQQRILEPEFRVEDFSYAKALCTTVFCSKGEHCVVKEGAAQCVCRESCPEKGRPTCGSNGVVYHNVCELYKDACQARQRIHAVDFAHCQHLAAGISDDQDDEGGDDDFEDSGSGGFETVDIKKQSIKKYSAASVTSAPRTKLSLKSAIPVQHAILKITVLPDPIQQTTTTTETSAAPESSSRSPSGHIEVTTVPSIVTSTTAKAPQTTSAGAQTTDWPYYAASTSSLTTFITDFDFKANCDQDDYEFLLNNLLLFYNAKFGESSTNNRAQQKHDKRYLVERMFSDFDQNKDSKIDRRELEAAEATSGLQDLEPFGCRLIEILSRADSTTDKQLSKPEFLAAFGLRTAEPEPMFSRAVYHRAPLGSQYQIRCNFRPTTAPVSSNGAAQQVSWQRYGRSLSTIPNFNFHISTDGDLYLTPTMYWHSGNFTCTSYQDLAGSDEIRELHIVNVVAKPKLEMKPDFLAAVSGEAIRLSCKVQDGRPQPKIQWTKNGELYNEANGHDFLYIQNASINDTATYACKANNEAGEARAFAVVLVREEFGRDEEFLLRRLQQAEPRLVVFAGDGVRAYNERCELRAHHQLHAGGQPLCSSKSCTWGQAVRAGSSGLIYATLPKQRKLVIFQAGNLTIVQVLELNHVPKRLHYMAWEDSVWLESWRDPDGLETSIEVVRTASTPVAIHSTTHALPLNSRFDVVESLFLPEEPMPYGYVVHRNDAKLHKVDLHTLSNASQTDLSQFGCHVDDLLFVKQEGLVVVTCREQRTGESSGQLLLDYFSDAVLQAEKTIHGVPVLSPDRRFLLNIELATGQITMHRLKNKELTLVKTLNLRKPLTEARFVRTVSHNGYRLLALSASEGAYIISIPDGKVHNLTDRAKRRIKSSRPSTHNGGNTAVVENKASGRVAIVSSLPSAIHILNMANSQLDCTVVVNHANSSVAVWT